MSEEGLPSPPAADDKIPPPSSPGTTAVVTETASSSAASAKYLEGRAGHASSGGDVDDNTGGGDQAVPNRPIYYTYPAKISASAARAKKPLTAFAALVGECLCDANFLRRPADAEAGGIVPLSSYLELDGIECINLGSVEAEQTPPQRVKETIRQLGTEPSLLMSIGYLSEGSYVEGDALTHGGPGINGDGRASATTPEELMSVAALRINATQVKTLSVPLEIYEQNHPGDLGSLTRRERAAVGHIRNRKYAQALLPMGDMAMEQIKRSDRGNNKYLAGMMLHNMAVVHLLDGNDEEALRLFTEAVEAKKAAFGSVHPTVAESLDEIGIQCFAQEKPDDALRAFLEAKRIRAATLGSDHPKIALVLGNIGCVHFQKRDNESAVAAFQEARDILESCMGSERTRSNLDLLHMATILCNLAYLHFRLKKYDESIATFEDALLVQQSVLGDDHPTIRDTLSNISLANAFHS